MQLVDQVRDLSGSVSDVAARVKQYAGIAAGGLGLTGGRAAAGPLHAEIGICDPCNHKCVFCYNYPPDDRHSEATADRFGSQPKGLMCFETFKSIVDDLHRMGTRRLDLVGRGEPLLNRSAVDMVVYAKSLDMHVILCTNASKLSAPKAETLVSAGLDRLNVSLNAGTPENYPNIHVTETPENYLQVKKNLRYLADWKAARGSAVPYVRLSFIIGAKNYFELEPMVEVARDVGATECLFTHNHVHDGTTDLALDRGQYADLLESRIPAARRAAAEFGIDTNLNAFADTVPSYLTDEVKGPPIVPCYVGYYFTVVLGNGSVLPCCQCDRPIDTVSESRSFSEIWNSDSYREFRKAARDLPSPSAKLGGCECEKCYLRPRNISIHNVLHPTERIEGGDELFSVRDLLRMKIKGSSLKVSGS
jgi:MoaA/NifB/PqqE/SkfB family radical SAM enzyme